MLRILCLEVATLQRLCWLIVIVVVITPVVVAVVVAVAVGQRATASDTYDLLFVPSRIGRSEQLTLLQLRLLWLPVVNVAGHIVVVVVGSTCCGGYHVVVVVVAVPIGLSPGFPIVVVINGQIAPLLLLLEAVGLISHNNRRTRPHGLSGRILTIVGHRYVWIESRLELLF